MALQGNPFLGKLKIPAPDLSHIPETPFESKTAKKNGSQSGIKVEPNLRQNEAKLTTNLQQSHNKLTTKSQQTGSKQTTNLQQTYNKLTAADLSFEHQDQETYNKLPTQLTTQPPTNLQQSHNKLTTNLTFLTLVGLQRKTVLFFYELCRSQGRRVTEPVSISNIAISCKTTSRAAQETIRRIEQKGFIRRAGYKNGRGGWTIYEMPEEVYKELFQLETSNKLTTKSQQTSNKLPSQLTTEPTTSSSSSSSFLDLKNFKTTTTEEVDKISLELSRLDLEWQQVDSSPLFEIGFTQTHLVQIMRDGKLSSESVQDSINYFAFDLNKNGKRKEINGQPLNFFMGILRRGMPYAAPVNYESPQDQILRKNLEAKRLQVEKRNQMEAELKDLEFEEWYFKLSEEEKLERVPMLPREGSGRKAAMRSQFEEHVWPERAQEVLGLTKIDRAEVSKQIEQSLEEMSSI